MAQGRERPCTVSVGLEARNEFEGKLQKEEFCVTLLDCRYAGYDVHVTNNRGPKLVQLQQFSNSPRFQPPNT